MNFIVLLGRICYSLIFILSAFGHFSSGTIAYATAEGVPMASLLVPATGVLILLGGLSILLGYRAKLGAWLLVLFLVPTSLMMHKFWGLSDPGAAMIQQIMFLKNVSMLGAAFLIAYFGSGPLSLKE